MSVARTLVVILLGYGLALAAGVAAVLLNGMVVPVDASRISGGMFAFGDMVLLVIVTGVFGLVPTWLLMRLLIRQAPRALLGALLLVAVTGPLAWLAIMYPDGASSHPGSAAALVPWLAIPRAVLGPVVLAVEALAVLFYRNSPARWLLVLAMLLEILPLALFTLHMFRAMP